MLTPLGAGGRRRRRRRWLRALLAVLVVLVVVGAVGGGLWWWSSQSAGSSASPSPTGPTEVCVTVTPRPDPLPTSPASVAVAVYNSTTRPGLAIDTADALVIRGFNVVSFGNDPRGNVATGVGQIRYGPRGAGDAWLLAAYVPGATLAPDNRRTAKVDLALGPSFRRVATRAVAAKTLAATPQPVPSPSQVCRTPGTTTTATSATTSRKPSPSRS